MICVNIKNNKTNYCPNCGAEIEEETVKYCSNCGNQIKGNSITKKILKGMGVTIGIFIIIFIALVIFALITGAGSYPDHAYQDNIDGTTVYIPTGYKHIETKNMAIEGLILKTATYKNKQGQTITISVMSEGEMYIMGHGKKIPAGSTVNNPDGSTGILKQRGNNYILVIADNSNILNSI